MKDTSSQLLLNIPPGLDYLREKIPSRILAKIDFSGPCWLWTGHISSGYGRFGLKGRMVFAHRYFYKVLRGDFDPQMDVCHKCDVPTCVNPDHLFLGTHRDNMADAVRKGRTANGEKSPKAKLSTNQVMEIREKYLTGTCSQRTLAKEYGVSRGAIRCILEFRSWNCVTNDLDEILKQMDFTVKRLGENQRSAKLNPELVKNIRDRREHGVSLSRLAAEFQMSKSQISKIVNRLFWRHV